MNIETLSAQQPIDGRLIPAGPSTGRRRIGGIAATFVAASAIAMSAFGSAGASDGLMGESSASRVVFILTGMLVLGGAFMILRTAISHDHFTRRLDELCRELEASNSRLEEYSFKDDVTGLYNRRFFDMRLEHEVSRYCRFDHPVSVALIDIDGFKRINDELGRAAGDETLRAIGDALLRHSRNIDVICRYGADEFAVLLVETGKRGALYYAERIRRQVENITFGHGRGVTVSIGVACLPDDVGAVPDDVVTTAAWALSEAKRTGKNQLAEAEGRVPAGAIRRGGWDL